MTQSESARERERESGQMRAAAERAKARERQRSRTENTESGCPIAPGGDASVGRGTKKATGDDEVEYTGGSGLSMLILFFSFIFKAFL